MKNGIEKVSRRYWYATGGFSNNNYFRRANKRGVWSYFIDNRY